MKMFKVSKKLFVTYLYESTKKLRPYNTFIKKYSRKPKIWHSEEVQEAPTDETRRHPGGADDTNTKHW